MGWCLTNVGTGDGRQLVRSGGCLRSRRTGGAGIMAGIGVVFMPEQREAIRCGDLLGRAY